MKTIKRWSENLLAGLFCSDLNFFPTVITFSEKEYTEIGIRASGEKRETATAIIGAR